MTPLRILIAEDDSLIGMLLGEMLVGLGHFVYETETTEAEAVAAAIQQTPDLMIIDAALRTGSGVSAVQTILQTGFVPHFFVSGNPGRIRRQLPNAVVLEKPFREIDVVRAIERAFSRNE
jgi:CheY-like chemotaxis protein